MVTPATEAWIGIGATCVVQFGVTLILFGIIFFSRRRYARTRRWSSTMGSVTTSKVEGRGGSDGDVISYPLVVYQYTVGEKSYTSEKIRPGTNWGGSGADKVIARYPVGSQVAVYYDPANPSTAALERNPPSLAWAWIALILLNACFAGIVVVIAMTL